MSSAWSNTAQFVLSVIGLTHRISSNAGQRVNALSHRVKSGENASRHLIISADDGALSMHGIGFIERVVQHSAVVTSSLFKTTTLLVTF